MKRPVFLSYSAARRRGRTYPGSAAAAPINLPRAEGAAAALDPRRAQLPAPDLSRIRSRPGPCRSACRASRTPRRPAAATGGRRAGRNCYPSLCPAAWPDVPKISGSGPDRSSQGRRRCRCPRSAPGAAAHAGSLPDQEQAPATPERLQRSRRCFSPFLTVFQKSIKNMLTCSFFRLNI